MSDEDQCGSRMDGDSGCPLSWDAESDHDCMLEDDHDEEHVCDCGVTW